MTQGPPGPGVGGGGTTQGLRRVLTATAGVVFVGAVGVFLFGVILTSGVYGSRMAWLLGIVLPLLVLAALFAGLAAKAGGWSVDGGPGSQVVSTARLRRFAVISLGLVAVPFAIAGLFLLVYGVIFTVYGLRVASHWVFH
ncbi:MAG TPA: hypothetical protein VHT49_14655 [Acidimicrobiales bacterium]|jgi:hypothetical protein|nr:hypothetical protein [Acidimicrobiales bacterium]